MEYQYATSLHHLILLTVAVLVHAGCRTGEPGAVELRQRIASEIDSVLTDQLALWYPRFVDDEQGGFLSRATYDWQPVGPQNKFIVTQARHTWTVSKVAERIAAGAGGEDAGAYAVYIGYGRHGLRFLRDRMWDEELGGFYSLVDRKGDVIADDDGVIRKELYGNAFALYGLAALYGATGDTSALNLAKKTFHWLDGGSHDAAYGGYFNSLTRQGKPYRQGGDGQDGAAYYPKDYNSGIHILEALAEFYRVWPNETVRARLAEMFRIVRDTFTADPGYLHLYFTRDLRPVTYADASRAVQLEHLQTDHITFGHDIETAFLLLEAAQALEYPEDSVLTAAKRMVDHTIEQAWDEQAGGFFDRGYYFEGDRELTVTDSSKVWWAQAEALHSLLIMADRFPDDPHDYFDKFTRQWAYIRDYLIDGEYGGWYEAGLDFDPGAKKEPKAHIWKGNYHTVRTLLRCLERLEGEGSGSG